MTSPRTAAPGPTKQRRRPRIALLFDYLSSEYAVQLRRAVERSAAARNVDLLVVMGQSIGAIPASQGVQNRIYELLSPDCVDGVIVVSGTLGHYSGPDGLLALCRSFAPLAVCSLGVALDGVPSFVVDNLDGMERGTSHLIEEHKCSRLAFFAGPRSSEESNQRLAGFRAAHAKHGLEVNDRLIVYGNFTRNAGIDGMRRLLARGEAFDAVVAANDNTALGCLEALDEAGIHVPRDVMVCGFDDINSAHFARPTLSTLRQPMWWMGERAVDSILKQIAGEDVPLLSAGPVEFVRRESCGCGYQVAVTVHPSGEELPGLRDVIRKYKGQIGAAIAGAVSVPNDTLGNWPSMLLDALDQEFQGVDGRFTAAFEELLHRAQSEGASLDEFQRVVSVLRTEFRRVRVQNREEAHRIERIWHGARVLVGAASIRLLGRQKLLEQQASTSLARVGERLAATLSLTLLKEALVDELPTLDIHRAAVSLFTGPRSRELESRVLMANDRELEPPKAAFPERQLAPAIAFESDTPDSTIVMPITFESEFLGVAVLGSGALATSYESVRQQIGSAIKGAMLHHEMVQQVAMRERLEHERVTEEARVAAAIQTGMNPVVTDVAGLELAGLMLPTAETGGDYYDVIPMQTGAWLAIGDVTGHGLAAGLVMLMLQSMVAALARAEPEPKPSELVSVVGDALWDNVRGRLKRDDHATLTVFRYYGNGAFRFAGAHEDIVVWRAATGRCETIPTPGFWVGALPSVRRMTTDSSLQLEPGDAMVLYTDGVTEPRNAHKEQFSLERLVTLVEHHGRERAGELCGRIVQAVRAWSASLDDDITLLVVRYVGETSGKSGQGQGAASRPPSPLA